MPIASLESLIWRNAYLPYLQAGAVDVAIVDTLWNGVGESVPTPYNKYGADTHATFFA